MKPVNFPEHNKIYAKDQKEYLPFHVHESDINGGMTISCWQLSFIEYPFERKPK